MQQDQILNQQEFDHLMPTLKDTFKTIYNGKSTNISYNDTYSAVYRLCKKGNHNHIITQLTAISQNHYKQTFSQLQINSQILENFSNVMAQLNQEIDRIMEVMLYVETNYFHQQASTNQYKSIKDMLNALIFKQLCNNRLILEEIGRKIAENKVKKEYKLINDVLQCVIRLDARFQFFSNIFVPSYQPIMCQYYREQSLANFQKLPQNQFFKITKKTLQEQREFLKKYFLTETSKDTLNQLMLAIYDVIVTDLKQKIYSKDPVSLFMNNTCQFLQVLEQRGDNQDIQKHNQWFMNQIKDKLTKIQRTHNKKFLQQFIKIYHQINNSLTALKKFNIRYKAVFFFEDWINQEKIQFPKRISMYLEEHLVTKIQQSNQVCLKNFKELFKFLKEKDLFEKIYRRDYVNRMIYFRGNLELQDLILGEMRLQCGDQWLDKINKIREWPHAFDSTESSRKNIVMSLPNITLIEDVIWPINLNNTKSPAILPQTLLNMQGLQQSISVVEKSLKIKLQLNPYHGTAIIQINFNTCKQQFKVDTCALAIILYLEEFNSKKSQATLKSLLSKSQYQLNQVVPALQELSNKKIIKIQGGNLTDTNSKLTLCQQFEPENSQIIDLTKIHINTQFNIASHTNQQQLQPDRKTMVSALVIKAMKSCKISSSEALLDNVKPMIETRGFMFDRKFVMNIINDLVDRDFMREIQDGYEYLPV